MNASNYIFKGIRILSIIAMIAVLSIAFITPISFIQGLLYNPILFVLFLCCFSFAHHKVKFYSTKAEVHNLPIQLKSIPKITENAA